MSSSSQEKMEEALKLYDQNENLWTNPETNDKQPSRQAAFEKFIAEKLGFVWGSWNFQVQEKVEAIAENQNSGVYLRTLILEIDGEQTVYQNIDIDVWCSH